MWRGRVEVKVEEQAGWAESSTSGASICRPEWRVDRKRGAKHGDQGWGLHSTSSSRDRFEEESRHESQLPPGSWALASESPSARGRGILSGSDGWDIQVEMAGGSWVPVGALPQWLPHCFSHEAPQIPRGASSCIFVSCPCAFHDRACGCVMVDSRGLSLEHKALEDRVL